MTRAELLRLVGRRDIRRRPRFGPKDRKAAEPTMAPTRGLTPEITTPGPKTYLHGCAKGVAVASWHDGAPRVPVTWLTWDEWRHGRGESAP